MAILKVLLITALGLYLTLERVDIMGESTREQLNKVVFFVFNPALVGSNLAQTITYDNILLFWFMPINIFFTFIIGSALGWILVKITRAPQHLKGLILGCCAAGSINPTVYAFSIDNFRRKSDIVRYLMNLMLEKIEELLKQESIVNQYGIRLLFVGDLRLLAYNVRVAAEKATANNTRCFLLVCVAYTSTDKMAHAIEESCKDKLEKNKNPDFENGIVKLGDVEKKMYMAVAPDPDILIRSSCQLRLRNFLTWQTDYAPLYCPAALWPELGLWHIVWGVLIYQRSFAYLEKARKQS